MAAALSEHLKKNSLSCDNSDKRTKPGLCRSLSSQTYDILADTAWQIHSDWKESKFSGFAWVTVLCLNVRYGSMDIKLCTIFVFIFYFWPQLKVSPHLAFLSLLLIFARAPGIILFSCNQWNCTLHKTLCGIVFHRRFKGLIIIW